MAAPRAAERALVLVSGAQLGAGVAGQALAMKRRHPCEFLFLHGDRRNVARDSLFMGTALSAPVAMLVTQALATAELGRGSSERAVTALGVLGAMMVPGYLGEALTRKGLTKGAWNRAELRVALTGTALAAGMVALAGGLRYRSP
jgi:uncharacterized membrane protein